MTHRTSVNRKPLDLGAGSLVVVWPDYRLGTYQPDEAGEWLVTADPIDYGPHVRVDYRDEQTGAAGTWFLPASRAVRVALVGRELQQQTAEVLGLLASRTWLPEVGRWEVSENGLEGVLVHTYTDQDVRALEKWREYLETAETHHSEISPTLSRMWVAALVSDVPVTVSVHAPTPQPPAAPDQVEPAPSSVVCSRCEADIDLNSHWQWIHRGTGQQECVPGADPVRNAMPVERRADGTARPPADPALLQRVREGLAQLDDQEADRD
ncbi:hypothetical protein [Actinomadura gamaensis]|uniref:C2H2-type domain-containing protein n=1 Tax=Actinomadura gamaensis TaxID=1763541 RepID=A0ABV9U862_9ACTN